MSPAAGSGSLLILLASARSDGATGRAVARLRASLRREHELIDLSGRTIRPFDYERPAQADDFDAVVARMLAHDALLFATPVYWYAMSGLLKTLFDRFTDLLSGRDSSRRGRRLAGREAWLLAVGADPDLPDGFETPFRCTADYLGMSWRGGVYVSGDSGEAEGRLEELARRLGAAALHEKGAAPKDRP